MIPGLVAKDVEGRILIEYHDVLRLDVSAIMEKLFDKVFGPQFVKPDNVIPIAEGKNDQT